MANFVQIANEILNLDHVSRIERGEQGGTEPVVVVYFTGDEERTVARFSGTQADAVWQHFCALAEQWRVPIPRGNAPAGPGRVSQEP